LRSENDPADLKNHGYPKVRPFSELGKKGIVQRSTVWVRDIPKGQPMIVRDTVRFSLIPNVVKVNSAEHANALNDHLARRSISDKTVHLR
jgi:hypothetical protein